MMLVMIHNCLIAEALKENGCVKEVDFRFSHGVEMNICLVQAICANPVVRVRITGDQRYRSNIFHQRFLMEIFREKLSLRTHILNVCFNR